MKLLVICQYYAPEPVRLPDICTALVQAGHEVDVVTGVPNYPMGEIYEGYRGGAHRDEVLDGVHVHRCFTVGRRHGPLWRVLNYYSYAWSSARYVRRLKTEYDAVLVNQLSPVMMAGAGVAYKKKHRVPLIYYCLDLWPESLVAGGVARGSFVYRLFGKISAKLYAAADRILVTSRDFIPYFRETFGTPEEKLAYLPQYAESLFDAVEPVPQEGCTFTFAGNVGAAQDVPTIIRAAAALKDLPDVRFRIVGDGSELENCRALAAELGADNVRFDGRLPVEEMPAVYAASSAMLVTLSDDPFLSRTLPGKVQSYLAAGRPILGAVNGEAARVIADANCGLCVPSGDADALAQAVRRFREADAAAYAANARAYYEANFTKEIFMTTLLGNLKA